MSSDEKRLFFGFEVHAPWRERFPQARLLDPAHRHITVAFLGKTSCERIKALLPNIPKPPFQLGHVGVFDACLFLPPKHPRVVAYHVQGVDALAAYQKDLVHFLEGEGFQFEQRDFLPHTTIGRGPFVRKEWEDYFSPLPMYYTSLHLYESLGHSRYGSVWHHPLRPPFIEVEHVADQAFHIYGESMGELHLHAQMALCFGCPALFPYLDLQSRKDSLEEVIIHLNEIVTQADQEIGTPFKAVSFHGEVEKEVGNLLKWEMIVDV